MTSMPQTERIQRRLRIVRLVAFVDLVLLITLVSAALTGGREIVHILGPLHGINFLLLLVMVGAGAIDGVWGWWFPVVVLLTAGPPGAFLGEWILHRRAGAQILTTYDDRASEATVFAPKEGTDASDRFLLVARKRLKNQRKGHL